MFRSRGRRGDFTCCLVTVRLRRHQVAVLRRPPRADLDMGRRSTLRSHSAQVSPPEQWLERGGLWDGVGPP